MRKLSSPVLLCLLAGACAAPVSSGSGVGSGSGPGGKDDSGWLSDTSFEVDAVVRGVVTREASGEWAGLATDAALQTSLIDLQVKFAKNTTEANGFRINQLIDSVDAVEVQVDGDLVTLRYAATVDMISDDGSRDVPALEEIEPRVMQLPLPLDPVGVYGRAGSRCANDDHAAGYNYHYYYDPSGPECDIELSPAELEIVEVFERRTVYPEYDRLMRELADGSLGFTVALVPAEGDSDRMSRFDAHRRMLEAELGLTGEDSEDGAFRRYEWVRSGVKVVIDLFDPTRGHFTASFQNALRTYQVVFYNGHSAYGTQRLLTDPEAFSDDYQIIMLHSCQSYAYYVQQAFHAKATEEDPDGFASTDFVATGRSSYPTDSPVTLQALLEGLMTGIAAVHEGNREAATDWLSIVSRMNRRVPGILYGVAGVRTNEWQP